MYSITFTVLLLAAAASAQSARGSVIKNSRAADPAAVGAAASVGAAAAPAAASAAAPAAAPAPPNPFANCAQCFGPGVNNIRAIPPHPLVLQQAMEVARTLPNVRLFFDVDGSLTTTDQFGREVEVVDSFGRDPFDFEEQLELQQKTNARNFELQQERSRLEQQLSTIMRLLNTNVAGAGGAAAAAAPAAAPAVAAAAPAPRFSIQV